MKLEEMQIHRTCREGLGLEGFTVQGFFRALKSVNFGSLPGVPTLRPWA